MNLNLSEEKIIEKLLNIKAINQYSVQNFKYFMNKIKKSEINFKYRISPVKILVDYDIIIFNWKYLKIKLSFNKDAVILFYNDNYVNSYVLGNGDNQFNNLINELNRRIDDTYNCNN